jgi:hypothetical protein
MPRVLHWAERVVGGAAAYRNRNTIEAGMSASGSQISGALSARQSRRKWPTSQMQQL